MCVCVLFCLALPLAIFFNSTLTLPRKANTSIFSVSFNLSRHCCKVETSNS
ncbi:hypothetical protein AAHE18_11G232000 [Arachis hypogaea]